MYERERGRAREADCSSGISLAPSSGAVRNWRFLQTGGLHENGSFLMHSNIFMFYWWNQVKMEVSGFLVTDERHQQTCNFKPCQEANETETSCLSDPLSKTTKETGFSEAETVDAGRNFWLLMKMKRQSKQQRRDMSQNNHSDVMDAGQRPSEGPGGALRQTSGKPVQTSTKQKPGGWWWADGRAWRPRLLANIWQLISWLIRP